LRVSGGMVWFAKEWVINVVSRFRRVSSFFALRLEKLTFICEGEHSVPFW